MGDMQQIISIKSLLKIWASRQVFADDVGVAKPRVDKWAQMNAIPARFHGAVLRAAKDRGVEISAQALVDLHDRPEEAA